MLKDIERTTTVYAEDVSYDDDDEENSEISDSNLN